MSSDPTRSGGPSDPDATRGQSHPPADPTRTGTGPADPHAEVGTAPAVAPVDWAGLSVPGYQIECELGRGAMGIVFKARDVRLNRVAALKMVLGGVHASASHRLRFLAEAEAAAAVRHPHVVQVYEFGEASGHPFLALEYLSGGTLTAYQASGRREPAVLAALMEKIARGVAAAHEAGIVHRDLKPGNILFDEKGEPKVGDFGLAKRAANDLTATQALMGTPAYMAPEQAAGRAKFVGPQADVWALGVILYECVAGVRPFDGDTTESLLSQIQSAEPTALRTRVRSVPRDLNTIVSKCLAKEPEHRYPTAAELADDLGRFVRGEPIAARPVGRIERLIRWTRRKPTAAAAYGLSGVAVLLALVVLVIFGFWREAERAKVEAEVARDREEAARQKADDLAKKLTRFEYGRTMQVAHQEWRDNNTSAMRALLDGTKRELRGWEWHYLDRLREASHLTLKGHTGEVLSASFSADGSRIVTGSADKTAKLWDARTGAELLTLKGHTSDVTSVSWSSDGTRIVTGSDDKTARVWDVRTGAELLTLKGHTNRVQWASFSPDGSRIVTGAHDKTARVWDARTGAELLTLKGHTHFVYSASYSGDGSRIVTGSEDKTARVWDARSGAELLPLKGHTHFVESASYSGDDSRIVTGSADNTARVWDARTGAELLTLKGHTGSVGCVSWSGDGSRILTAGDTTATIWDSTPLDRPKPLAPMPRASGK